jgi:hypothetical protein
LTLPLNGEVTGRITMHRIVVQIQQFPLKGEASGKAF